MTRMKRDVEASEKELAQLGKEFDELKKLAQILFCNNSKKAFRIRKQKIIIKFKCSEWMPYASSYLRNTFFLE